LPVIRRTAVVAVAALAALAGASPALAGTAEPTVPGASPAAVSPSALSPTAVSYPAPAGAVFVAPTGNDAAAGTQAAPLRTVDKAVAKVPAGGTVVLRGGDYRDQIANINKRITLQPFQSEIATVKGTDVLTRWAADNGAWRALNSDGTTWTSPFCQNCYAAHAIDAAHPLAGQVEQVFRNDVELTQVGSRAALAASSFFVDPTTLALYVGADPAPSTMEVSARWKALQLGSGAAGSVLQGLRFSEFSPHWNEDQLAAVIVAAPNTVLRDDTFTRSATRSLGVFAAGVQVLASRVTGNGGSGLNGNRADGLVLRGSTFSGNNTAHYSVGSCQESCTIAGAKVSHTASVTVDTNTFADNDGSGFWCDLGCTDGSITGNTVARNTNNGLFYEVSARGTITGNTVTGNARGLKVSGSDHTAVTGNTFTDNTVQLGVYDDPRSSTSDSYSSGLGLTWNTTGTVVSSNHIAGGTPTTLLLDTNHTAQIGAAQMFSTLAGNTVTGQQAISWCPSACTRYATIAAFSAATGLPFTGSAVVATAARRGDGPEGSRWG
jgi:mannuronan 5-epimerase